MFFAEEKKLSVLNSFLHQGIQIQNGDDVRSKRLSISNRIIESIKQVPEEWDKRCSFNIKHIGDDFIQQLTSFNASDGGQIDRIYVMSYRFLCEFDFFIGSGKKLAMELNMIKTKIMNDASGMDEFNQSQIIYASYMMPVNIAQEFLNDPAIETFSSFESKKNQAETLKKQWDKEISDKKVEIDVIKDKLDEYKVAFNFVGLYKGFEGLGTQKEKEASKLFWSLVGMGFIMLMPLLIELMISVSGLYEKKPLSTDHLIVMLPLVSIEVILVYFFRVLLHNFNSVKAQKMQIELRQTLCQFIQSYASYAADIKKQDSSALDKFENLIFSGILADPGKLPSTYDGLDQIGKFVKSLKS